MPLRDLVLTEMRAHSGVVSAYALTGMLSAKRQRRIAPNSVYRVLNELIAEDCVRHVETCNGFVIAPDDDKAMIAICNDCNRTFWLDSAAAHEHLLRIAGASGFRVTRLIIEVPGSCEACSQHPEMSHA